MLQKALTQTKVKKAIGHDRMSLVAQFPSGANLRWTITRYSETLTVSFSKDMAVLKDQTKTVGQWIRNLDGTNTEKFDKVEALLLQCKSGKEVIELIKRNI